VSKFLSREYQLLKRVRGREPSIAEVRAHAHETIDAAIDDLAVYVAKQAAKQAAADKVVKLRPARHEEAPPPL
jgi:hypothetical protein